MAIDFFKGESGFVLEDDMNDCLAKPGNGAGVGIAIAGDSARITCRVISDGVFVHAAVDMSRTELYGLAGFFLANFPEFLPSDETTPEGLGEV